MSDAGIDFVHDPGETGEHHLPETMGAGVAWYDFDGDGWLDLFLVQSGPFPPAERTEETVGNGSRLFRNLGPAKVNERLRFEDWTARANLVTPGYGQGVLPIDLDSDGVLDLYLANYGDDVMLLGTSDGSYRLLEVPAADPSRGDDLPVWSSSAAAADADGDGDLDLYVARYLDYDPGHSLQCGGTNGAPRQACDPALFEGTPDAFYRNQNGELRAEDLAAVGLAPDGPPGKGLGVVWTDLDGDHWPDLYVANDLTLNALFRSRAGAPGSLFEEWSLPSGAAANAEGKPEAGMGLGVGDFDADGDPELLVTNFDVETNTLYENLGSLFFEDAAARSGFGLPSFNRLGFGLVVADYDLDGRLDVYVANGHIFERPVRGNVTYEQADQLLRGSGPLRLEVVECAALGTARVSRGAAGGDLDNDGDVDLAINNLGAAARVLVNDSPPAPSWVGIELIGRTPNRQAIGARLRLRGGEGADTWSQDRWVMAGDSYQSSSERRHVFGWNGLEEAGAPSAGSSRSGSLRLEINWPGGRETQHLLIPRSMQDRYLRIVQP